MWNKQTKVFYSAKETVLQNIVTTTLLLLLPMFVTLRCGRSWRRFWGSCHPQSGSSSPTKGGNFYPILILVLTMILVLTKILIILIQRCCACGQVGDPRLMENKVGMFRSALYPYLYLLCCISCQCQILFGTDMTIFK